MSWLSNKSLLATIRKNATEETLSAFQGIYSIDNLPSFIPHRPFLAIINTHTHNLPGEHWLAVYIDNNKHGELFDSLALPVSNTLIRWLNRFTVKWKTNTRSFQHPLSDLCGAFVLYFILNRLNIDAFESISASFTPNHEVNEKLVTAFYKILK